MKAATSLKTQKQPIGVFDSGVGGLSVLIELQKLLPHEDFVFLADQLYVPYGEKTKEELVTLVFKITDFLINEHNIKMMVVACNTATCGAIAELREKYSIPIVGTVPAVKPAAEHSKTGTIAVIATPSTSKSIVLKNLIRNFCQNVDVINIGCKNLENAVEEGELESEEVQVLLEKYLEPVKNSDADQLVLGCTHYPFLKKTIQKMLGKRVTLVDSGKAIARRTKSLLLLQNLKNPKQTAGKTLFFSTGNAEKFTQVASSLLEKKIKALNIRLK